ncbi:MAG: hypothetical protein KVP17_004923 [Porospora cf. gigantea B]|uniref:uncharacterized protein n=1 Tax=Porospora cf. gigantea B TaxID=2853592 RepID=UPI003571F757|nr:MAG: hypothetical protein KVP17_004923 [Porospora cf. gigantea B]
MVSAGDRFPNCFVTFDGSRTNLKTLRKAGLFFGVTSCFDPVSDDIVRSYVAELDSLRAFVHYVCCVVVADINTTSQWASTLQAPSGLRFLADPNGDLCRAIGTLKSFDVEGLGLKTQAFSCIVDRDLEILWVTSDPKEVTPATALTHLRNHPHMKRSFTQTHAALREAATLARLRSHSPYSKLREGCAILTKDGRVFQGSTFENCAYPNSISAVKAAVISAISGDATAFEMVCFAGQSAEDVSFPSGSDRELLVALGDVQILCTCGREDAYEFTSSYKLLPHMGAGAPQFLQPRVWPEFDYTDYSKAADDDLAEEDAALCVRAIEMCKSVFVPISHFPVGAAVRTDVGVFGGSNVELQPLDLGTCAERSALCTAVANGATGVQAVAVVGPLALDAVSPCGSCRQNLAEWGEYPLFMITLDHQGKTWTVHKHTSLSILPLAFTPAELGV